MSGSLFFLVAALGMDCAYHTPVLDSQWVNQANFVSGVSTPLTTKGEVQPF
jgi:hypothetical protein